MSSENFLNFKLSHNASSGLQDISFFDAETVGDLTSRLGADCQQVSRVIGNDLNLISRNVLQVPLLLILGFSFLNFHASVVHFNL